MPDMPASRPFAESDFGHQYRLDPMGFADHRRLRRKRRLAGGKPVELFANVGESPGIEAGADITRIHQRAIVAIHPQHQCAEPTARALRFGPPGDHEFLPVAAFEFDPVAGAGRAINRIPFLSDDTLQPQLACRMHDAFGRCFEYLAETHRVRRVFFDDRPEQFPPFDQWQQANIPPVEVRCVEKKINDIRGALGIECILQRAKIRHAFFIQHHDFTVVPAGR